MGMHKSRNKTSDVAMFASVISWVLAVAMFLVDRDIDGVLLVVCAVGMLITAYVEYKTSEMKERVDKIESYFGGGVEDGKDRQ